MGGRLAWMAIAGALVLGASATPALAAPGDITEFPGTPAGIHSGANAYDIARGPDGNLWFAETQNNSLGRMSTTGVLTEFPDFAAPVTSAVPIGVTAGADGNIWSASVSPADRIIQMNPSGAILNQFSAGITAGASLRFVTAGPDGNVWFSEATKDKIGHISTSGVVTETGAGPPPNGLSTGAFPQVVTAGPDGKLWFTEFGAQRVGSVSASGTVFESQTLQSPSPRSITTGPDGNLWFTEEGAFMTTGEGKIGRITPSGTVTEFSAGLSPTAVPSFIAPGPDGNLWFTEANPGRIGRITPTGEITEFTQGLPNRILAGITAGADGNMWVAEQGGDRLARVTTLDPPRFANPAAIGLPGIGAATAYPSTISVSGIQDPVSSVRVRLFGLSHNRSEDIDMLLVGPQGQKVMLMSDAGGGGGTNGGPGAVHVPLSIDDAAAFPIPAHAPLVPGLFKPTDYGAGDTFPATGSDPPPVGPYAATLSAFNGTNGNGTWKLYVADDAAGEAGALSGGWGLDIATSPPAPAGAGGGTGSGSGGASGSGSSAGAGAAPALPLVPGLGFGASTNVSLRLAVAKLGPRDKLAVKVSNANAFPITGSVAISTTSKVALAAAKRKRARKRVALGTHALSVAANGEATLSYELPARVRSLLTKKGKVALTASATVVDPQGTGRTVSQGLTPRLKAKPKKKR